MLFELIMALGIGICVGAGVIAAYRQGVKDGKSMQGALPPAVTPFFSFKKPTADVMTADDMLLHNINNPDNQFSNEEISNARGRKP